MTLIRSRDHWQRPLTATKLDPPLVPAGLIERTDVLRGLISCSVPLVLIDAPAGWGKSSLIASWAASDEECRPLAYLRLGAEDDEPGSFWAYVVAALRGVNEGSGPDLGDGPVSGGTDPIRSLIPAVINRLRAHDQALILVLDDYHVITDPQIHRTVDYLIENAPGCLQVVIVTRVDPPLALSRLRASGGLVEVRAADLRLSVDDTRRMLQERFGLTIDRELAAVLCERTEGWPAGIQLAALSLGSDPEPSRFITSFAGDDRNVADYLTSEVLRRQPEKRLDFLLKTSVLDDFSAELCDHLLDVTGSSGVLEELEHENLFLVPLDTRRHWFRYHHLFRDWLRHNHTLLAEADEMARLHRRAAGWLLEHELGERAVGHLVAAGDVVSAAARMEHLLRRLPLIDHAPVRSWLGAVPDEIASSHPAICLARISRSLAVGDVDGAAISADLLETALGSIDDADQRRALDAHTQVYRGLHALVDGDAASAARHLQALVDHDDLGQSTPAAYAQGLLGMALHWTEGTEAAVHHLRDGALARRRLSMPDAGVTAHLAAAYAELDQWGRAEEAAAEAFALPSRRGSTYPSTMAAHFAMAQVHKHRGRHGEAVAEAQTGLDLARAWVQPGFVSWGCVVMARLVSDAGHRRHLLGEARRLLDERDRHGRVAHQISAAERVLATGPAEAGIGIVERLTTRELDIVRLFRSDLTLRAIANELYISHNTAKGHTKAIYRKLGVRSRADAIAVATRLGLL